MKERYLIRILIVCLFLCLPGFVTEVRAQDWPRFRGDVQLRGRTELKTPVGQLTESFNSFQLGGGAVQPITADIDNDGQLEIIYLRQGQVVASRQDGTTLVSGFFGATELIAVTDIDGDGSTAEIIAVNSFKRQLLVINSSGSIRWQHQFPEFVTVQSIYFKVADIALDKPGKEIVVFPDHTKTEQDARGYFFSSSGLLYNAPVIPNLFGGQLNFPQIAIGDIDGDAMTDIVVVGRPRLMIFSGQGELKQQLEFREGDAEGRHYGLLNLADVNGDGKLDAVVIADDIPALSNNNKAAAITVFQLSPTIKRLWGTSFPQQTLNAPLNAVADLDGDGRSEIVVNIWTGNEQQVRVYNGEGDLAKTGQPMLLSTFSGTFVWDLNDLNLDGHPELMSSNETVEHPTLNLNSQLKIYSFASRTENSIEFSETAKPLTGMYVNFRPALSSDGFERIGSSNNSRMKIFILGGQKTRFLVYTQNAEGGINLQERSLVKGNNKLRTKVEFDTLRPGVVRSILGPAGNESFLVNREVEGLLTGDLAIYVRRKQRLALSTINPILSGASFTSEVRVADLDEDGGNEILVRGPGGRILVLGLDENLNSLVQVAAFNGNSAPIIQALDGSKGRPQIITTRSDGGRLRIAVYETRGTAADGSLRIKELWGRTFEQISGSINVEMTTGHFGGLANRIDIFFSTPRGSSFMLSGENGDIIWTREDIYTFGNHVAVRDSNRDGKDDLYIVSDNLYRIVDGNRGVEIFGPVAVNQFSADFNSTPILSGDNEVLMVGPATVVKMLDQGKPIWNFSKTVNGKITKRQEAQFLMGLAELGNGGGFDRIGGNFGESDAFYAYDYTTGLLAFKTLFQPVTEIITADTDGDGKDEFIFGTAEGQIVALRASDGGLVWSIKTDSFPADPILAAIGKDKRPVLIFAPGDGALRVYRFEQR
jgi:outer membrane protein assembly factor BamB